MSEPPPCYQPKLPKPAVNLALRAVQLSKAEKTVHKIELIFINDHWLMIANDGNVEDLGKLT